MNPDAPQQDKFTCALCALSGALLAGVFIALLFKILFFAPDAVRMLSLDEQCQLEQGACTLTLPDGETLEIEIGVKPVPLVANFPLRVQLSGGNYRPVEVDFIGENFPMAFVRAYLSPENEGRFSARTALPLCANGRMIWRATVRLEHAGRQVLAPFRFETVSS